MEQIAKYSKLVFHALIEIVRKLQTELPSVCRSVRDWILAIVQFKSIVKIFPRKLGFPKCLTGAFPSLFKIQITYQLKKILWKQANEELNLTLSQGIEDLKNNNIDSLNENTDGSMSVDENDENKTSKVAQEDVNVVKQFDNVKSEEEQELEVSADPEVKAINDTDGGNKVIVEA